MKKDIELIKELDDGSKVYKAQNVEVLDKYKLNIGDVVYVPVCDDED